MPSELLDKSMMPIGNGLEQECLRRDSPKCVMREIPLSVIWDIS